jgi:predicted transcriptional regulator
VTLQKSSLALLLSFVIIFSFVAVIQMEKNNILANNAISRLTEFSGNQIAYQDIVKESPVSVINNSTTRLAIYDFISVNPGVQFRGICAELSIAIGTAEFHLGVLKKAGLISFVRDGKYKRFFISKKFSVKEMKLISLLRHETIKEIIKKIMAEKTVPHSKLASHLSITSQGLTWQINRLRDEGIIKETSYGTKITYSLNETYVQMMPELLNVIEQ